MSNLGNNRQRRRFLADLLFAGGALAAAAWLAQARSQPEPTPTGTPLACPNNSPLVRGEAMLPSLPPTPEPRLGGKPAYHPQGDPHE